MPNNCIKCSLPPFQTRLAWELSDLNGRIGAFLHDICIFRMECQGGVKN